MACHEVAIEISVETNGTRPVPRGVDWVCVSPKAGAELKLTSGNELKLVYPQEGLEPHSLESMDFENFFLQPKDGPQQEQNTAAAVAFCKAHPRWKLSLQTHKLINIP
jgi:organic radical activating enzyme